MSKEGAKIFKPLYKTRNFQGCAWEHQEEYFALQHSTAVHCPLISKLNRAKYLDIVKTYGYPTLCCIVRESVGLNENLDQNYKTHLAITTLSFCNVPTLPSNVPPQRGSSTVVLLLAPGTRGEHLQRAECVLRAAREELEQDGRCCSHPAPASWGSVGWEQLQGCQELSVAAAGSPGGDPDSATAVGRAETSRQGLARRTQFIPAEFFWICVWVASCWSLKSCQRCLFVTMVWGKAVQEKASELSNGLKYFSFTLC